MSEIIEKKLIIVGLDNAGKSTIIETMKEMQNPKAYNLRPTKAVNIENFTTIGGFNAEEITHIVWDFGGQEQYREKYLQDASKYFSDIDSAIYVIDIQDKNRFKLSLEYLKEILEFIYQYNPDKKVDFLVFIHKFDPELKNAEEYKNRSKYLKEKVKNLFGPYNHTLKIFETSIFTVFQQIEII